MNGTITAPKLSVKSSLDDVIARRLKAVVGEEVAKAEAFARAKVEPVRQRIAAVQADATKRVADERARGWTRWRADLQAELEPPPQRLATSHFRPQTPDS